jgi:hypothetical protein
VAWRKRGGPVFVDRSGRRRRLLTVVGAALAVALLASLALLLAGLVPGGAVPLPGWPDAGGPEQPGPVVEFTDEASTSPDAQETPGQTVGPVPTGTPTPTPDGPGNSDEHRRDPPGKPTKSPGRPG